MNAGCARRPKSNLPPDKMSCARARPQLLDGESAMTPGPCPLDAYVAAYAGVAKKPVH